MPKHTSTNHTTAPRRFSLSPMLRDSVEMMGAVPTIDQVKEKFAPPLTLGTPESVRLALDAQLEEDGYYSLIQHSIEMGVYDSMSNFMGYGNLQSIAQNGLIRACVETVSDDMTRNWIELKREGAEDKNGQEEEPPKKKPMVALPHGVERPEEKQTVTASDEKLDDDELFPKIMAELKRLDAQKVFHEAASMVGYYGGCLIYLDTGAEGDDLRYPLNLDPKHSKEAKERGFLKAIRVIDPINVFPGSYNSTNPLAADYYRPKTWWVLGQEVHASRLLRLVANEAPLVFRPNYNFLGIPQAQILWDYVVHFQSNRDSLNRMLGKFSLTVFKTAMSDILNGNANNLAMMDARMQILARNKSNDGVFAIDKDAEDVVNVTSTMTGMTDVVRQSLEILAALNRTPAVKLLGISPSGFNATGESDLRNYYDHVLSQQEKVLRAAIQTVIGIVQISLFGRVDSKIGFDFCSLSEEDEASSAMNQSTKVNTLMALLDRNVLSPEEVRAVLANDPKSGLDNIDPEAVPEPQEGDEGAEDPMSAMMGGMGEGDDAPEQKAMGQIAHKEVGKPTNPFGASDERVYLIVPIAQDASFDPDLHPRDENGQFTDGNAESSVKKDITDLLGEEIKGVHGRDAVEALIEKESGYVKNAFHRDEIGDIDLIWGDETFGLSHIIKRRLEEDEDVDDILENLSSLVNTGKVKRIKKEGQEERFIISKDIYRAIISTELKGNKIRYVLTAFFK